MDLKISVIIPCYNAEEYLERCICSLKEQTMPDWEALLIDDGSKDGTGALCNRLAAEDSRCRVFHQRNSGVSAARNKGLQEASGEWICFLDADDWLSPETFEFALSRAVTKKADIAGWAIVEEYDDHQVHKHHADANIYAATAEEMEEFRYRAFSGKNRENRKDEGIHNVVARIIRKKCISGMVFDTELTNHEDVLFMLEAFEHVESVYFEDLPYYHRSMHADSAIAGFKPKIVENNRKTSEKYRQFLEKYNKPKPYYEVWAGFHVFWMLQIFELYCFHPDNKESLSHKKQEYLELLNTEPFASAFRERPVNLVIPKKVFFMLAKYRCMPLLIPYSKWYCSMR